MNEQRFRAAETRLWQSVGVAPAERHVRLDRTGVTVRLLEVGVGPAVVFVHGATNGATSWASLAARLPGFRCILLDRPGCGLSDPVVGSNRGMDSLDKLADDLIVDVLDALDLQSAHVASTSFGGYFAFRGAAAHPDRIDRIIEYSWPFGAPIARIPPMMRIAGVPILRQLMSRIPPNQRAVKMMLRQIGLGAALQSGSFTQIDLDWYLSLLRDTNTVRNDLRAVPRIVLPIGGLNTRALLTQDVLSKVRHPVYFLWGGLDPQGGAVTAEQFAGRFVNAQLEMMPAAGHAPWMDDPDHAAMTTERFLCA